MKFLLITLAFVGACIAQEQGRRYYQQQQQQQQQPQQQPEEQQYNSQHQEHRPRHETTTYIPIIRFDKEQGVAGTYKALWETGNHILAQEEGYLKDLGPDPDQKGENLHAQVQQGSYTYTAPNGEVIVTHYTADETGFHVFGDHLPTPPPVSEEVQKGLDLIYAGIKEQERAEREFPQEAHSKQSQEFHGPPRQQPNQIHQDSNRQQYRQ
ncbi:hypothetical protein RN001_008597 [Aquatica leii]|uniref:Uncharacterized protein n=1 Tax=Aquatica leii TaxID=1421715 RepID=A0AAN7PDI0_9COLE|nr:hypothetical protein RN001_008597 [Aquatica leii]